MIFEAFDTLCRVSVLSLDRFIQGGYVIARVEREREKNYLPLADRN